MAVGGGLFSRAMNYLVNEVLVEGLANNRTFQRFAVRTSKTIEELQSKAMQAVKDVDGQLKDAMKNSDSFKR